MNEIEYAALRRAVHIGNAILTIRKVLSSLANSKEEQDSCYFFSCGIARLEMGLNEAKAIYMGVENAVNK